MSVSTTEPTAREVAFQRELRELALARIEQEHLTSAELAHRLGMLPVGVELLMERQSWPVSVGLRVAEALNIDLRIIAA